MTASLLTRLRRLESARRAATPPPPPEMTPAQLERFRMNFARRLNDPRRRDRTLALLDRARRELSGELPMRDGALVEVADL